MFHGIEHVGKFLGDVVDRRSGLPAEPQGRTLQTSSSPAPFGRLGKAVKGAAGSPILDAGQVVIAGMRLTTGSGDPERGERFGLGAERFSRASATVGSAYPMEAWQGSGAQAYATANLRQAGRAESISTLDRRVQSVIAREAYQVAYHRDRLDEQSDYLGDLSYLTWSMALIPGTGKAMKAAFELAAVNAALSICGMELYKLAQETGENALQLRELAGEYSALTGKTAAPDLDDAPPPWPAEEPPRPDRPDQPGPGQGTLNLVPGLPPTSSQSRARATDAAPVSAPEDRLVEAQAAGPAQPGLPAGSTTELMSGMATAFGAFGAVGGMIGSAVAPLAAVLTGAAGAAGQSLSLLGAADNPATGDTDDTDDTRIAEGLPDTDPDDGDRGSAISEAGRGDDGPVMPEDVSESEDSEQQSQPRSTATPEQARPPVPPAATRPPQ